MRFVVLLLFACAVGMVLGVWIAGLFPFDLTLEALFWLMVTAIGLTAIVEIASCFKDTNR